MALLRIFLELNICPNIIKKGKNIILLEIPEFHVRFVTSNNYIPGNEYQLAVQFNIKFSKKIFPEAFTLKANFFYEGKIPVTEFFHSIINGNLEESEVLKYITTHGDKPWSFQQNVLEFYDQKIMILIDALIIFLKQSFSFQNDLQLSLKKSPTVFVNPFNNPLCSLGSFTYLLYKTFYMNELPIYIVANEYGKSQKAISHLEYQFCSYMDYLHPNLNFQFAFNNPDGPKYFKEAIPDLYSPVSKEVFFFNGCYYHGHYENCSINKNVSPETQHPFGITYKQLNDQFFKKLENLMKNHPEITKVTIEWECNFKKKKKMPEAQIFFNQIYIPHCFRSLRPRDTVRGALSDVYALKWSQADFPDERFYCTDVNGLYSFCAINFEFMIGKYKVLIGKELEKLSILNKKFYFNNRQVMGAILLKILPPKGLFAPFLLYRKKDGSVVNTLCRQCSETKMQVCKHNDEERSFIATYMISEIQFALSLNYQILQIYEAHVYEEKDFILRDFVKKMNFFKTLHSDCLQNIDPEKHLDYCKDLNQKMNLFEESFIIEPKLVDNNPRQKNYFKLLSNALFGKFIQRTDQSDIRFVKTQESINDIYFSAETIEDFLCPNENICMLYVKKNVLKIPPNRKQNVYIGSQVTAFAREVIYKNLQKILSTPNATVYHVECDSIYFSLPKTTLCPLKFSHAVGDFKIEHGTKILSFYSFGPKHYNLNFLNDKNEIENICKYSGLSLKNPANKDLLNAETFKYFLDAFLKKLKN